MNLILASKIELFKRQVTEYLLYNNLDQYNYFLLEGGRGGGKTQRIGRLLLYLAMNTTVRIFCGREIQNTIEDSVYTVFKNIIIEHEFPFEIFKTSIKHTLTGSEFRFKGFREQGKYNIQGLEDIDYLWIDEAQAISKPTLDIIIPTIRKIGSKVFFSMNRFKEDDPVYIRYCRQNQRSDTLHLTLNYLDNKYLAEKMIIEANECKKRYYNDYLHIWMGEPQKESNENCALDLKDLKLAINRDIKVEGGIVVGVDVARFGDDRSVLFKRKGLKIIGCKVYTKKDLMGDLSKNDPTGLVKLADLCEQFVDFNKEVVFNIDDTGVGGGLTDILRKRGYKVNAINNGAKPKKENKDKYDDTITEMFFEFNNIVEQVSIPDDTELLSELAGRRYAYTKTQQKKIEPKKDYKKRLSKSPDKADGLLLCFYNPPLTNVRLTVL